MPLSGLWAGTFKWGPAQVETNFEVFPSGGSWQMLIGKHLNRLTPSKNMNQTLSSYQYRTDTYALKIINHLGPFHLYSYHLPSFHQDAYKTTFLPTLQFVHYQRTLFIHTIPID